MMLHLAGLVGLLLVLTAEAKVGNSSLLEICSETEQCLLYDPICKDNYEVRHYESVKWVSTTVKHRFMDMAMVKAFRKLFNYIQGENEAGMKIEMTTPVLVKIPDKKIFFEETDYTMSFLLPAEHQMNPPSPTDENVYIHDTPDMKVYVLSYGGWMMSWIDQMKAKKLGEMLDSNKAKYKKGFHYGVGYNSPMKLLNRHNEVWMVVEDEHVC
ncbi:heme-binding protein 2 [Stegastes partitus]|uniref:Heme-binding protein 1 n=1 Tax=Stegastes partitus TaxID=144197 RepID=A0A9Y4NIG6_9TELE|nr:PREDICTED: heme-binding protein 2-like [Stegastes partitus]